MTECPDLERVVTLLLLLWSTLANIFGSLLMNISCASMWSVNLTKNINIFKDYNIEVNVALF